MHGPTVLCGFTATHAAWTASSRIPVIRSGKLSAVPIQRWTENRMNTGHRMVDSADLLKIVSSLGKMTPGRKPICMPI
jgi:hypothetical protein